MVLQITPAEASKLGIWIAVAAIAGRFLCSWISDAWGRRPAGVFSCMTAAVCMSLAGYMHSVFIGAVSVFYIMLLLQSFFGSGNYSIDEIDSALGRPATAAAANAAARSAGD